MIDLESIAVRRAEEQMAAFRFEELPPKRGGMPMTARVCAHPECTSNLGKNNRSGFCYRCSTHLRWQRIKAARQA